MTPRRPATADPPASADRPGLAGPPPPATVEYARPDRHPHLTPAHLSDAEEAEEGLEREVAATELLADSAHVSPGDAALARHLARGGLAAVAVATLAIGLLHVLAPSDRLDPLSRTISEYALLSDGWVFNAGVVILAAGSIAILVAMVLRRLVVWKSLGATMTGIWALGLVGLIVFPKQGFGADPSVAGRVHWTWTLIAFFSLPIGAMLICRKGRAGLGASRWPGWAVGLSLTAAGWFGVLTIQTVLSAITSIEAWRMVGFVERALSLTEMAAVAALGLWVLAEGRVADRQDGQPVRRRPEPAS